MTQNPLVLFGAGPFAERMRFYFEHDGERRVAGFTVHEDYLEADQFHGLPCVGFETVMDRFPSDQFDLFVAIGTSGQNSHRQRVIKEALAKGYRLANYAAPSSCQADVVLPGNCVLMENSVLGFAASLEIGCYIASGAVIGHHTRLGACCYIGGNVVISGNVEVGERVFLGSGASTVDGVAIPAGCVVGAGSVITRTITKPGIYAGNPARFVRDVPGAG